MFKFTCGASGNCIAKRMGAALAVATLDFVSIDLLKHLVTTNAITSTIAQKSGEVGSDDAIAMCPVCPGDLPKNQTGVITANPASIITRRFARVLAIELNERAFA